ncbi:MAG TPA: sulfatase [Tepidisphaeraceae bacterium]|jgi:uncharacterized sulfatase|nr:sulfatase [Tepidisphaeraceae bacterium]
MRILPALLVVVGCVTSLGAAEDASATAPARKLNVLMIVSDDLNMHLGCYGDRVVQTPNIDRFAARGMRFDRAYCQYPVCNPSRTSFLSGLYPETTGVVNQLAVLRQKMPDVVYLPEYFKSHGYFTAGIGKVQHGGHDDCKWDFKFEPREKGGDEGEGDKAPAPVAEKGKRDDRLPYALSRQVEDDDPNLMDLKIAATAMNTLEEKRDQPFFLVVGFHRPHVPHIAPKRYFDLYPLQKMQLSVVPPNDADDIPRIAIASNKNYRPDMPDAQKRDIIAAYLACVSFMDAQVGRVMEAMDKNKLWDNTIVIFMSDHGWGFGEHNWWAKASLFEPSARGPLVVVAPGFEANRTCGRVVEYIDLYPTLAELCALPAPAKVEGKSFAPLLRDPAQMWDKVGRTIINRPNGLGRSICDERYRYTKWPGENVVELYDHQTDPGENTNLAKDPKFADVLKVMDKRLSEHP